MLRCLWLTDAFKFPNSIVMIKKRKKKDYAQLKGMYIVYNRCVNLGHFARVTTLFG